MNHRHLSHAFSSVALAFVLATAGCGGSNDQGSAPPPTQPVPAAGSATVGGPQQTGKVTIEGAGGTQVLVPPGAFAAPVTVRIAADSAGAPTLPEGLRPVGATYAITPHGGSFEQPVEVRIPAPAVTLQPNERLLLAKADPGGVWTLLSHTEQRDGTLRTSVRSFSYFIPVVVVFLPPFGSVTPPPPIAVTAYTMACGANDCYELPLGGSLVTLTVATNSGSLPSSCRSSPQLAVEVRTATVGQGRLVDVASLPLAGGSRSWTVSAANAFERLTTFELFLTCTGAGSSSFRMAIAPMSSARFPEPVTLAVVPFDVTAPDIVAGQAGQVEALLSGGAYDRSYVEGRSGTLSYIAPDATNRATVDWQRSDDGGNSWREVATSLQTDTRGDLFPLWPSWRYWRVRHGFTVGDNLSGQIQFRAKACIDAQVADGNGTRIELRCQTSRVATARVLQQARPITFTQQPRAMMVLNGQTATFAANATGLPAPDVSWQTRPANSTGAWSAVTTGTATGTSNSTYTTATLTLADNGTQFRARAFNSGSEEFSVPVTVSVSDAPVAPQITTDLAAVRTVRGGDATMAVAVRGTEPLSYQWQVNGTVVLGQNASVLRLQGVQADSTVSVVVSNGAGSATSGAASITVSSAAPTPAALSIVQGPVDTTATAGDTATLAVQTSGGNGTVNYVWERNGAPLQRLTNTPILTLPNLGTSDTGRYRVTAWVPGGAVVFAEAVLTVNPAGGTPTPLAISVQPVGLSAQPGQTALFAVAASGSGTLSYQWFREGVAITGATQPVLRLTALAAADAGNYSVTVSNAQGSVSSNAAGLVVLPAPGAPQLIGQVTLLSAVVGDTPRLGIAVRGTPAPQCLWLRNGALITGATDCTGYVVPSLTLSDNGAVFTPVAYNAAGALVLNPIVLQVTQAVAPTITTQPQSQSITDGGSVTFGGSGSGTPAPASAWSVNGTSLPVRFSFGAFTLGNCSFSYDNTGGALSMINVTSGCNGATVVLTLSNSAGSANSNPATLTVVPAIPTNALTATQIVAGPEWSLVLRPDRSVWGWGRMHRSDGTVQLANLLAANQSLRPVRMYPTVLTDVRAISGWFNAFWALQGEPGTTGSRVLHWGRANAGSDGRGVDGNGSLGSSIPTRDNEAAPVEVLERVGGVARPVDRVCAIAGGGEQLAMIRAINSVGATTDCNAGSAKTVWFVGSLQARGYESTGVAFAMPGLPTDSPPVAIFTGQTTSGSPGLVIALEDGRSYGLGINPYGGFGIAATGSGIIGGLAGPDLLPASWGSPRSFGMSFYYSLFVVRSDGSVMTSGYDNTGELGLGSVIGGSILGPRPVLAESCVGLPCTDLLTGVTAIAATQTGATLALKNGQILAWGARDSNGLRGPGVTANQPFPRGVASAVTGFTGLSASYAHALLIGPGNVVYAFGSGLRGALGDGVDGGTRTAPEMVTTP